MKHLLIYSLLLLVLTACFQVNPENRVDTKELISAVKHRKPKRIKDAELTTSALDYLKTIATHLPKTPLEPCTNKKEFTSLLPDSLQTDVNVFFWCADNKQMQATEKTLFKAYQFDSKNATENIQNVRKKALFLYTKPVIKADTLQGMWSIWVTHKQVVFSL